MGLLTEINIFTILWLVLLPLPLGYLFKIIKTSFKGYDELPDFDNWKSIYLDGVKLIAVIIIYALPVLLLILSINYTQIFPIEPSNFSILNLWPLFIGPQLLIFIAIGLIEYMAIANMALYEGEISSAFHFREIIKRISLLGWKEYLTSYIIIWILALVTALISYLALLLLIGIVIIPLVIVPYFMALNSRFLALIFASSEDAEIKKG
jgi:hypothetical protein